MDYLAFERRLLRLIFRTNAPLTPVHVAYHLDIPIAEARGHLDHMVSCGVLELDSDEGGHLIYGYPMRPPLDTLRDPRPPRKRRRRKDHAGDTPASVALAPIPLPAGAGGPPAQLMPALTSGPAPGDGMLSDDRRFSPAAAAALSFFLPGVGQIYSGRVPQGIGWMLATGLGYLLFLVPGLILHICCVVNAAAVPTRLPSLAAADRIR